MGNVWIMGLYDLKEFLTFEDVADYLKNKGIYDFDLSQSNNRKRLYDFLKALALDKKLDVVFSYYGGAHITYKNPITYKEFQEELESYRRGEVHIVLLLDKIAFEHWLNYQDALYHAYCDEDILLKALPIPVPLYKLYGLDYKALFYDKELKKIVENHTAYYLILHDDNNGEHGIEPLFPKAQLDVILTPSQSLTETTKDNEITALQAQLDQANARIADLESQLTDNKPLGVGVSDNELLAKIFDDTKPYIYPPELHNAIRVWQYIYHDCLTSPHLANHSDKFDKAVKSLNIEFNSNALKDRLKQVTTPQQQKEKTKSKNS